MTTRQGNLPPNYKGIKLESRLHKADDFTGGLPQQKMVKTIQQGVMSGNCRRAKEIRVAECSVILDVGILCPNGS